MAAQPRSGSRWGSFLQQAVAGVESRLDTILADNDESRPLPPQNSAVKEAQGAIPTDQPKNTDPLRHGRSPKRNGEVSHPSSVNQRAVRLQDRLARAVVSGNTTRSSSVSEAFRTVALSDEIESSRSSLDGKDDGLHDEAPKMGSVSDQPDDFKKSNIDPKTDLDLMPKISEGPNDIGTPKSQSHAAGSVGEEKATADSSSQEMYLERIDALEAKLRFMTQETIDLAQRAAGTAANGSSDQRLAEKDEKIALLMVEGQALSQAEIKNLALIKKLRSKSAEDEQLLRAMKRDCDEASKVTRGLRDRLDLTESILADSRARIRALEEAQSDIGGIKAKNAGHLVRIEELHKQLAEVENTKTPECNSRLQESLDVERKRAVGLESSLSAATRSRALCENQYEAQLKELQANFEREWERERERTKLVELELRREIQVAESRLESYLSRAEEVTSEHTGESQAKFARQIEILQKSYSVASENWSEIEKSLMAQVSRLEEELENSSRKEAELRRKTRDGSGRCRELGAQVDKLTQEVQDLKEHWDQEQETSSRLQAALEAVQERADEDLTEPEAVSSMTEKSAHIRDDGSESPTFPFKSHTRTPPLAPASTFDSVYMASARQQEVFSVGVHDKALRSLERRSPLRASSHTFGTLPALQDPSNSITRDSDKNSNHEELPVQRDLPELSLDLVTTPATPDRNLNDMFSVSTAAAGPSVQLVERMSASVRRLESEKSALREELDRHVSQRSEAREQIVALMGELDLRHGVEARTKALEKEKKELSIKLVTTLEMLGEKSELVEELRADIADMKEIYRSTLENTVR